MAFGSWRTPIVEQVSFSLWGFQITWKYDTTESKIVTELVRKLENRRELFRDFQVLNPESVEHCISEIRDMLEDALSHLPRNSGIVPVIQAMQKRCRDFTTAVEPHMASMDHQSPLLQIIFDLNLRGLKEVFWIYIAILSEAFKITVRNELKDVLPDMR
jgi:hypothetical protein